MKPSRVASVAILSAAVMMACGDDDVDIREGASGMLTDSAVLAQMRDTMTVGRIIYNPPPDLSLASAQQRRPDIFRPPSPPAPRAASRPTTAAEDRSRRTQRE